MIRDINLTMPLPCVVFSTVHKFDDYVADDMQCGDLNEAQLVSLGVNDISERVDPYRLLRYDTSQSKSYRRFDFDIPPSFPKGKSITREECKSILFDEMRELSTQFAHGQYAYLIREMINHFQNGNGASYRNSGLDEAFSNLIKPPSSSNVLEIIRSTISNEFNETNQGYNPPLMQNISSKIYNGRLPRFDRTKDSFNGLGITIHDIYAQKIEISTLHGTSNSWGAVISFKAQDHFGLDKIDIQDAVFKQFRFFRIWFFLQRHKDYAFKPFFTNFNALIPISGGR